MPIKDAAGVGARVRALREARALDQEQVADRSGLSRAYVSRLENGAIPNPKLYDLQAVADALETSVSYLAGVGPPDPGGLRAELEALLPGGDAELLEEVLQQIGHWPEAEKSFVVELFRQQVFNWPRRPRRPDA